MPNNVKQFANDELLSFAEVEQGQPIRQRAKGKQWPWLELRGMDRRVGFAGGGRSSSEPQRERPVSRIHLRMLTRASGFWPRDARARLGRSLNAPDCLWGSMPCCARRVARRRAENYDIKFSVY